MASSAASVSALVAGQYSYLPMVVAVARAGSQTSSFADSSSDIDLYVYTQGEVPLSERTAVAVQFDRVPEIGNSFWEPGDEWIDAESGLHVDVMFRRTDWLEEQLARVLDRHEASIGYSTCFWHNVLSSELLFDRHGWFAALQAKSRMPYPEQLRSAVVARNFPILRANLSAYTRQLEAALSRGDAVSVNHRIAALLASYFDVIFAVNRVPHPGEKRLLDFVAASCAHKPPGMREQVERLLTAAASAAEHVLYHTNTLIDGLEELLDAEGLLTPTDSRDHGRISQSPATALHVRGQPQ